MKLMRESSTLALSAQIKKVYEVSKRCHARRADILFFVPAQQEETKVNRIFLREQRKRREKTLF